MSELKAARAGAAEAGRLKEQLGAAQDISAGMSKARCAWRGGTGGCEMCRARCDGVWRGTGARGVQGDVQGQVCVYGGSRGTQVPNRPWALGLTHSVTGFALPNELMLAPLIPLERRAYASPLIPLQGRAALRTGRHHGSAHRECREGTSPPGRLQRQGRGGEGDTEVSMPGCEVTTGKRIGNQQVPCIFHLQQASSSGNDLAAVLAAELDAKV